MKILLLALLLMNCIPNPLMTDVDKQPELAGYTIEGTLYTKDLIETPGIWYWAITIEGARKVYLDGRELEENYGYRLKGDTVIIFEVMGVESVKYQVITKGNR